MSMVCQYGFNSFVGQSCQQMISQDVDMDASFDYCYDYIAGYKSGRNDASEDSSSSMDEYDSTDDIKNEAFRLGYQHSCYGPDALAARQIDIDSNDNMYLLNYLEGYKFAKAKKDLSMHHFTSGAENEAFLWGFATGFLRDQGFESLLNGQMKLMFLKGYQEGLEGHGSNHIQPTCIVDYVYLEGREQGFKTKLMESLTELALRKSKKPTNLSLADDLF